MKTQDQSLSFLSFLFSLCFLFSFFLTCGRRYHSCVTWLVKRGSRLARLEISPAAVTARDRFDLHLQIAESENNLANEVSRQVNREPVRACVYACVYARARCVRISFRSVRLFGATGGDKRVSAIRRAWVVTKAHSLLSLLSSVAPRFELTEMISSKFRSSTTATMTATNSTYNFVTIHSPCITCLLKN